MTSWVATIIREITPARSLFRNVTNSSALHSVRAEIVTVHVINVVEAIVMITIIISLQSDCVGLPVFRFINSYTW